MSLVWVFLGVVWELRVSFEEVLGIGGGATYGLDVLALVRLLR